MVTSLMNAVLAGYMRLSTSVPCGVCKGVCFARYFFAPSDSEEKSMNSHLTSKSNAARKAAFLLMSAVLLVCAIHLSAAEVSAQGGGHTVFVEGNCDSPVPGTTIVSPGTCGDFDGDGRIGTAEDTDGADRIFGTINAALGPGTGAAAGTGINHSGRVVIVRSGRFAEAVFIGRIQCAGCPGVVTPGNVTLEAAPGVDAVIDAILQGDPAGGNTARQSATGIVVTFGANSPVAAARMIILRNLTVRNFARGAEISHGARILIDNCRFENNQNAGIVLNFHTRAVITNTHVSGTGSRTTGAGPNPGHGIWIDVEAQARLVNTTVSHNANVGIFNATGNPANLVFFKVSAYFNGNDTLGPFTNNLDPNFSTN